MKKFSITRISIAALTFMFATVLFSCQKDLSSTNNQTVTEEQAASYSEESNKAREFVIKNYSLTKQVNEIIDLYKELSVN